MSRFDKMIGALANAGARCTWQGECHTGALEQWVLPNGVALFVQSFGEGGVEVYSNKGAPVTLIAIADWLGIPWPAE
jgi:hypothetical protein